MAYRIAVIIGVLLATSGAASAQQPTPLLPPPDQSPPSTAGTPLPPLAPDQSPPPAAGAPPPAAATPPAPPAEAGPSRIFCGQTVTYRLADLASAPATYRPFLGLWSDAAWTPQLCAALIVESVTNDGAVTITYAFGPIGSGNQKAGGVLHGTAIVQDGELKFQNNDGSQFAFKPFYSDLVGHWVTPKGDTLEAIFKKTF